MLKNYLKLQSFLKIKTSSRGKIILSKVKRKIFKNVWLLRLFITSVLILGFYLLLIFLGNLLRQTKLDFYFNLAKDFVFTPQEKIKSFEGRTNILILGEGGEGHEGKDLTDTIIFASLNHEESSLTLISLPRDIWIPEIRTKINSIYYWGNQKQENGGIVLAKSTVEEIVGEPVHYALVIDFSGFKKIIDFLGGIEVEVERSFTDERYPIAGKENDMCGGDPEYKCRYETVSFEAGKKHMDGETALKFVRSRNAKGDEGTDFARASRQQRVLQAVKDKVLSKEFLLSPPKLLALLRIVSESVETDITPSSFAILARRLISVKENMSSFVLPEDLLLNPVKSPKYDNLYVFIPKDGSWNKANDWVSCVLRKNKCS